MTVKLAVASAIALLSAAAHAANNNTTDPPIKWTIYSGYQQTGTFSPDASTTWAVIAPCAPTAAGCTAARIISDGKGDYANGLLGVSNSVIHFASSSWDATLSFLGSKQRSFGMNFESRVATNPNQPAPSWASGLVSGQGGINVRDILWPNRTLGNTTEYENTHRIGVGVPVQSSNNGYGFRMDSSSADADGAFLADANLNDYYDTAPVRVHHCPDTTSGNVAGLSPMCPAGHKESWYVYPDAGPQPAGLQTLIPTIVVPTQVGTLRDNASGTNLGQYSMPFFFKVELQ